MGAAIQVTKLRKVYDSGLEALKGIDLLIPEGSFYGLLGPNGAGKTTTIGIITGLVNITSGKASIMGYDSVQQFRQARRLVGLSPQELNFDVFFSMEELLELQAGYYGLSAKESKERTAIMLEQFGLIEKRKSRARELSGGMKRRVQIAKALVHDPPIVILDEPTAGVDIELRRSLWDFLTEINENGTTIILTTHYLEEAERLCRNIAIIDSGEIVENTSMQELLTRLEVETFVFDLTSPLEKLPETTRFNMVLENPSRLKVTIEKGQGLNSVFNSLSELGIEISSMRNETGRLEELFLGLVDSNLNDTK